MKKILVRELSGWSAGELSWMAFSLASVTGLSLHWGDSATGIIAALTGMMYTLLAGKGKISCYAFGLVNTPLYAYTAWRCGYYGDAALNIYYFAMMFAGIASWRRYRHEDAKRGVVKTRLSARGRTILAAALLSCTAALWAILLAAGGSRPFCDALTNTLSVAAMVLTVRRAVEQWTMWIAVDAIEVFMWWKVWAESGNSVSLLSMWMLFLANGIWLRHKWLADMHEDRLPRKN